MKVCPVLFKELTSSNTPMAPDVLFRTPEAVIKPFKSTQELTDRGGILDVPQEEVGVKVLRYYFCMNSFFAIVG